MKIPNPALQQGPLRIGTYRTTPLKPLPLPPPTPPTNNPKYAHVTAKVVTR